MSQMSNANRLAAIRSEADKHRNNGSDIRFLLDLLELSGVEVRIYSPGQRTDFEAWEAIHPEGAVLTLTDKPDHSLRSHRPGCPATRLTGQGATLSENRHCLADASQVQKYAAAMDRPLIGCGSCRT